MDYNVIIIIIILIGNIDPKREYLQSPPNDTTVPVEPPLDKEEPPLDKEEPPLIKEEPHLDKEEPHLDKEEPHLDKEKPHLDKEKPPLDKVEPPLVKDSITDNDQSDHGNVNDVGLTILVHVLYCY